MLALRRTLAVALLAVLLAPGSAPARADGLLVFAAASLKNALDEADAAYKTQFGVAVTASYLASGPLAKQIANGAPADIFISADQKWMDYVANKKLIQPDSRADLLGNDLVLVAPADKAAKIDIKPGMDLKPLLGDGRLALGDPASVPAGTYAQAALEKLGLWAGLQDKLAKAESVRAALALVSRGEAPLGIVYVTDVAADKGVQVAGMFPADSHPPIVYPAALLTSSKTPAAARAYLTWLESSAAAPYFEKQGFHVLHAPAP